MQASTERRSVCSGVMIAAGAPSWVRGRARWASLRMFSFMLSHLLLCGLKISPGNKRRRSELSRDCAHDRIRTCTPPWLVVLITIEVSVVFRHRRMGLVFVFLVGVE